MVLSGFDGKLRGKGRNPKQLGSSSTPPLSHPGSLATIEGKGGQFYGGDGVKVCIYKGDGTGHNPSPVVGSRVPRPSSFFGFF
jgi:hypothetical protein